MAKMTSEMQEMFNRAGVNQLATSDKSGVPNVVPINFMKILDDETILASAVFMTKTFQNLKENTNAKKRSSLALSQLNRGLYMSHSFIVNN